MSLVLDASYTLSWSYGEQDSSAMAALFARIQAEGAFVPSLWRLEVANVLEIDVRRGRHPAALRARVLERLSELPIEVDGETDRMAWTATLKLAMKHQLTLYDAAYLELAVRRKLPLATYDRALRRAAEVEGVEIVG